MGFTTVIMAAGRGTRMLSATPKILHPLCGRPLVAWPVEAAIAAGSDKVVVICSPGDELGEQLPGGVEVALQSEARGTGDAVRSAADWIESDSSIVVLSGDSPLVTAEIVSDLVKSHAESDAAATLLTTELAEPASYGRIVRDGDGNFERVVETKEPGDADERQLEIKEINTGTYCFDGGDLTAALEQLGSDNAQGEYYLGDVFDILIAADKTVSALKRKDWQFALGINTRVDLAQVSEILNRRIVDQHMLNGVTFTAPATAYVEADVKIGADTVIGPNCVLKGSTEIGKEAEVGPSSTLIDSTVGEASKVLHSYLQQCKLAANCQIGPFAYLRPDAQLAHGAKAGAFVEVKNSTVGAGTKIPHLSYIGDSDIGSNSNIGAGNITANYDGKDKHRTVIGSNVRTGVDTAFVAPVILGDDVYTGAGSVITDDVPDGALAVARARQKNIDGYKKREK